MSHELNLAITIPEEPVVFAAPVLAIFLLLIVAVLHKKRARKGVARAWSRASDELGVELVSDGSDLGPVASGKVNSHVVSIAPALNGAKRRTLKTTQYSVKFEAPEAPKFVVVKRVGSDHRGIDTGNPKFDAVASVQTDQPAVLTTFLTPTRRAAILRLLTYWPTAEITNREAHLHTPGIERDADKLVDSVCHLVAAAETFDHPTPATPDGAVVAPEPAVVAPTIAEVEAPDSANAKSAAAPLEPAPAPVAPPAVPVTADSDMEELVAAARAIYESDLNEPTGGNLDDGALQDDGDLLTEVRLDEVVVLADLFNSGLDLDGIDARFQQLYQGCHVNWTGEVLRLGPNDRGLQRIAAFVGSADGQTPESGRVVALTAVDPDASLTEGAVVSFSGSLVNLNAAQRLFHVV